MTIHVVLVNLGSPTEPTKKAVAKFLKPFLSDPRVVNNQSIFWKMLLNWIIIPRRAPKVAKLYQSIWLKNPSESPITYMLNKQKEEISKKLNTAIFRGVKVYTATSYTSPIVQDVVRDILKNSNLDDKLVVLPLYPQYSSSTTGSIVDAVNSVVAETKRIIDYKVINSYYANPAYIKALAEKIKSYYDFESTLIFSYHGIPLSYGMNGDYYYQHCLRTTELVAKKLKLDKSQYKMVFQSQFGKAKWLEPAILDVLDDLSKNGNKKVTVVCPGFSADCLETLEEINKQDREIFISNGGLEFTYVPALNIDDAHIDLLTNVILNNINLSK